VAGLSLQVEYLSSYIIFGCCLPVLAALHGIGTLLVLCCCWLCCLSTACSFSCLQECSAGDSAAYQRRNTNLDDVVIVSALRTPLTKVSTGSAPSACTRQLRRGWSSSSRRAAHNPAVHAWSCMQNRDESATMST
jgi:hypothetical protein